MIKKLMEILLEILRISMFLFMWELYSAQIAIQSNSNESIWISRVIKENSVDFLGNSFLLET